MTGTFPFLNDTNKGDVEMNTIGPSLDFSLSIHAQYLPRPRQPTHCKEGNPIQFNWKFASLVPESSSNERRRS